MGTGRKIFFLCPHFSWGFWPKFSYAGSFFALGCRFHLPPEPSRSKLLAPRARSSLFDCFGSIAYKSGQEWNFCLIFTYFVQNFTLIAAKFSNSKFVTSTKSYACSTKPPFPPSEKCFLGPTHLTFLPGKLARSKLFGWILHIFFGKAPRFRRRPWIQDRSHLRPLNASWVKMLWPILAVAEQHKLEGQQLWFPLP